jgi:hypothetical protein
MVTKRRSTEGLVRETTDELLSRPSGGNLTVARFFVWFALESDKMALRALMDDASHCSPSDARRSCFLSSVS